MRLLHSPASPPDLWATALGPGVSWGTLPFPGCPILPSQRLQGSPCPPRSCQASLTDLPFSARPQLPEGPPKHRAAQAPPDRRPSISSLAPGSVPTAQWALGVIPPRTSCCPPSTPCVQCPLDCFPSPRAPVGCPSSLPPPLAETRYHRPVSRAGSPYQSLVCHSGRATSTRSLARGVSLLTPHTQEPQSHCLPGQQLTGHPPALCTVGLGHWRWTNRAQRERSGHCTHLQLLVNPVQERGDTGVDPGLVHVCTANAKARGAHQLPQPPLLTHQGSPAVALHSRDRD